MDVSRIHIFTRLIIAANTFLGLVDLIFARCFDCYKTRKTEDEVRINVIYTHGIITSTTSPNNKLSMNVLVVSVDEQTILSSERAVKLLQNNISQSWPQYLKPTSCSRTSFTNETGEVL